MLHCARLKTMTPDHLEFKNLEGNAVHLYLVELTGLVPPEHPVFEVACPEEQSRAEHRESRDKIRFLLVHCLLRLFLGKYLRIPPGQITFETGRHSKPILKFEYGRSLQFNLSHTGEVALFGFTRGGAIGVDIERSDRPADYLRIARRICTGRESENIMALPEPERSGYFFTLWTRKEAVVKGTGEGLGIPLRAVEVDGCTPLKTRLDIDPGAYPGKQEWMVADIDAGPAYCAAYAVPFVPDRVSLITCSDTDLADALSPDRNSSL